MLLTFGNDFFVENFTITFHFFYQVVLPNPKILLIPSFFLALPNYLPHQRAPNHLSQKSDLFFSSLIFWFYLLLAFKSLLLTSLHCFRANARTFAYDNRGLPLLKLNHHRQQSCLSIDHHPQNLLYSSLKTNALVFWLNL